MMNAYLLLEIGNLIWKKWHNHQHLAMRLLTGIPNNEDRRLLSSTLKHAMENFKSEDQKISKGPSRTKKRDYILSSIDG